MNRLLAIAALSIISTTGALAQAGSSGHWIEGGARVGWFTTRANEDLDQTELWAIRTLRWTWTTDSGWSFRTAIEASAGSFRGPGASTVIVAAGPILRIRRGDARWHIDVGSRPTLIGHNDFGSKQFGGPFQFTSHGAIGMEIGPRMTIGFRFHHMSNARLYSENEGTNMHSIQAGWRF